MQTARCLMLFLLLGLAAVPAAAATVPSGTVGPALETLVKSFDTGLRGGCRELYIAYLEIFSMFVEDLRGEFELEEGHVLVFKDLHGRFYNGTLEGTVRITIGSVTAYRVDITFSNVDFRWFAMNLFDPGTAFKGGISGELKLSGTTDGDVHGKLVLRLKDGFFEKLPRWFTMFSLVNVNPMRPNVISKGWVELTIENDRFVVDPGKCRMETEDIYVFGQGTIDFEGNADILLSFVGKHKIASVLLPPIAVMWKWIDKAIWKTQIKGPIFSLQFRIAPLFKL